MYWLRNWKWVGRNQGEWLWTSEAVSAAEVGESSGSDWAAAWETERRGCGGGVWDHRTATGRVW